MLVKGAFVGLGLPRSKLVVGPKLEEAYKAR